MLSKCSSAQTNICLLHHFVKIHVFCIRIRIHIRIGSRMKVSERKLKSNHISVSQQCAANNGVAPTSHSQSQSNRIFSLHFTLFFAVFVVVGVEKKS